MRFYRRRLPHLDAPGTPTFITWRLHGSLPAGRTFNRDDLTSGQTFAVWDKLLDNARTGPHYLAQPAIADLVAEILRKTTLTHAYVIIPNHVHLLCTPTIPLADLMQQIKGTTARQANALLGRSGTKFWQEEYFDRQVRNANEFKQIKTYIERNPVKAALAPSPEIYRWSSASDGGLQPARGFSLAHTAALLKY